MRSPLSHIHAPRHRDQPVASTRPEQKHPNGNMRTYPPDIAARLAPNASRAHRAARQHPGYSLLAACYLYPASLLGRFLLVAQVMRRVDQRDVGESLGKISEQALSRRVIFFR